jgi:hypothetical protein
MTEEIDWITITDETDFPPDDDKYFWTLLRASTGMRQVVCFRRSELWQASKPLAWMHCEWPEPYINSGVEDEQNN